MSWFDPKKTHLLSNHDTLHVCFPQTPTFLHPYIPLFPYPCIPASPQPWKAVLFSAYSNILSFFPDSWCCCLSGTSYCTGQLCSPGILLSIEVTHSLNSFFSILIMDKSCCIIIFHIISLAWG